MTVDDDRFFAALGAHYSAGRERFAPLVAALRAHGITVDDEPWDTGGGVLCLEVDLPPVTNTLGSTHQPYFLFSDLADSYWACGLYLDDSGRGAGLDPQGSFDTSEEAVGEEWTPDLAEATAAWFATVYATVAPWAQGLTYEGERHPSSYAKSGYVEQTTAIYEDEDIPLPDGTGAFFW